MTISINSVALSDVAEFFQNNCELTIRFKSDHHYGSIVTIKKILDEMGLILKRFYFRGVSLEDYNTKYFIYKIGGRTDITCEIPEDLMGAVSICIVE